MVGSLLGWLRWIQSAKAAATVLKTAAAASSTVYSTYENAAVVGARKERKTE
jgi:hypothetical protein